MLECSILFDYIGRVSFFLLLFFEKGKVVSLKTMENRVHIAGAKKPRCLLPEYIL